MDVDEDGQPVRLTISKGRVTRNVSLLSLDECERKPNSEDMDLSSFPCLINLSVCIYDLGRFYIQCDHSLPKIEDLYG
jgi:hypothetical protein